MSETYCQLAPGHVFHGPYHDKPADWEEVDLSV